MAESDFDVAIVGAGPNGLACASYLARAGGKVVLFERLVETGGGLVTEEQGGFLLNHHAIYMMLAEQMPPYRDLDLPDRGVRFVRPETQVAFLFEDRQSFVLSVDPRRSAESIARLSPPDAETFLRMEAEFRSMCERFLIPATYVPPVEPVEQLLLLKGSDELGRRIAEFSDMTPRQVVASYGFRDRRVEAAFLYLAMMFGLDADEGALGFLVPLYVHRMMNAAIVRGGSHQLSSALRREFEARGGVTRTSTEVAGIVVEDGAARGVRLKDGQVVRARAVLSTLNPQQTFLEMCPPGALPRGLVRAAQGWHWEEWSHFVSTIAYLGAPPAYEGYHPEVREALTVVMGFESPDDVLGYAEAVRAGKVPHRVAGHASCLSLFDRLQVPYHLAEYGPYSALRFECWAPRGVDWEATRREMGAKCFATWCRHSPDLREDRIRVRRDWSPADIEARLPTMRRGSIKHGAYTVFQMGYNRPTAACSSYRTPVTGLYVAGASTHPGGMVILGPGYNAARVAAEDLGLDVWWEVPPSVKAAREAGYLPVPEIRSRLEVTTR